MKGFLFLLSEPTCGDLHEVVTKADLHKMEVRFMSAISDYADKVTASFTDIGASVDGLVSSVAGVASDVASLKATIDQLQNSPGQITPADQALLDKTQAQAQAISDRIKSVATDLKTLDDATAPAAAPTP